MSKIVLAVSDRWVPDARVDAIGDFAARLNATILAVHVAYGTEASGADLSPGERVLEQIARQLRSRREKTAGSGGGVSLGGAGTGTGGGVAAPPAGGTAGGSAGGGVETLFLFSDDLGQAILKTANEHKATMIVLGLSSKGVLTRLIEGNVAQEIIRGARIPVLLLPPDWMSPI